MSKELKKPIYCYIVKADGYKDYLRIFTQEDYRFAVTARKDHKEVMPERTWRVIKCLLVPIKTKKQK